MKKTVRIFIASLVFTLVLIGSSDLFAASELKVIISGKEVSFNEKSGRPFIDENSRTQVPFRAVMEAAGASVSWDPKISYASARKGLIKVDVPIWKSIIYKNGYPVQNDTYSRIVNGRTYLPIRMVLESLGYDVYWKEQEKAVVAFAKDPKGFHTVAKLPAKYDLRSTGRIDPVRNQGMSPHCWAFAASSALSSTLMPSEKIVFSPLHMANFSGAWDIYPEGGGTDEIAAAYYMSWGGPVFEKDYSYDGTVAKSGLGAVKHVQGFRKIQPKDFAAVKKAIYEKGPVMTSIYTIEGEAKNQNFYNPKTFAHNYANDEIYNHMSVLVGWDDNYPKENFIVKPKSNGAFIAKNSYGTEWGESGYYYISYEDLHLGTTLLYFTSIEPSNNYQYIYNPDLMGPTTWVTFEKNDGYYANIFNTGGRKDQIKAVALYSKNTSMDYEIRLVMNYDRDPNKFWKNGKVLAKGHIVGEGYETIKIPNPPTVEGEFAVVVYGKTKDEIFKIPLEQPFENLAKAFNINDGKGYLSDGTYWYSSEQYYNSNISFKVYTDALK